MKVGRFIWLFTTLNVISCLTYQTAFSDEDSSISSLPEERILPDQSSPAQSRSFRLGNPVEALKFVINAETSAYLLVLFFIVNVSIMIGWVVVHYVFWDPKKTTRKNRASWLRQLDFFTNPDRAIENIMLTWVNAISLSIFWALPTIFWPGQPRFQQEDGDVDIGAGGEGRISPIIFQEGNPEFNSVDRISCPNCVLTHILIAVYILFVRLTTFAWLPYLRPLIFGPEEPKDRTAESLASVSSQRVLDMIVQPPPVII